MNKDKHKLFMFRILLDAFSDKELSSLIAFKGGTALMFFHGLPRFSVDLDFNILDVSKKEFVHEKMRTIALKYGGIADEQMKHFGPIIVLDYGKGERNLKLELSARCYDNHYETKQLSGTKVKVMVESDMFAHKLCALLDRSTCITGRDVFDINFFLKKAEAIHEGIIEQRMKKSLNNYIDDCISELKKVSAKELMANVGELLDGKYKEQMRSGRLVEETIQLLEAFKFVPLIAQYPENEMPLEQVDVVKNKQGEMILLAIIGGVSYAERILSLHEQKQLNAYPEQEDKHNFLCNLAKSSYFDDWQKRDREQKTTMKL